MAPTPLKFLSEHKLSDLRENIAANRDRYAAGDFHDLEQDNGWSIETTTVYVDHALLATLNGTSRTAGADIHNSLVLHNALKGMTPALALEERIWARLTHIECLEYARSRWLLGSTGEQLDSNVRRHVFAPGLTGVRDDNSLSRLWWNMHIASIADPNDPEGALRLIVKTADIRQAIIERSRTGARRPLVQAIVRSMRRNTWITSSENAFREFSKVLNRDGGGILFEALTYAEADALMDVCASRAQSHINKTSA